MSPNLDPDRGAEIKGAVTASEALGSVVQISVRRVAPGGFTKGRGEKYPSGLTPALLYFISQAERGEERWWSEMSPRNAEADALTSTKATNQLSGKGSVAGVDVAYQGTEKIPAGKRPSMGRQTKMLRAVDASSLPKKYRAVIKVGIVEYADQDGLFFADQKDWGESCGCSREFVNDAVKAAVAAKLIRKWQRVYTTTGKLGTSIYGMRPETWSRNPEEVKASMNSRLAGLTMKPANRVPGGHTSVCLSGTTERAVLSKLRMLTVEKKEVSEEVLDGLDVGRESPKSPTPSIGQSMTDFDSSGVDLQDSPRAVAIKDNWPRRGRITKGTKRFILFIEDEGAERLLKDTGYEVRYQTFPDGSIPLYAGKMPRGYRRPPIEVAA